MSRAEGTSLARKIPLALSALLLVVGVTESTVSHFAFRRVLLQHQGERLSAVGELLGQLVTQSLGPRLEQDQRTARVEALERALRPRADSAAREAALDHLEGVLAGETQGLALALRDRLGACVVAVYRPAPDAPIARIHGCTPGTPEGEILPPPAQGPSRITEWPAGTRSYASSVRVPGPDSAVVGTYIRRARITTAEGTTVIASLIAPDARVVFGNLAGGAGTEGFDALPLDAFSDLEGAHRFTTPEGRRLVTGAAIAGTPWAVWVHRDEALVLGPARAILAWKLGWWTVLVGLFSFLAWRLARQITGPLAAVTGAAEQISRGDLSRRVPATRSDEIGRLAQSFNTMADAVASGREQLEHRVEERTRELSATVEQLRETQEELVRKEKLALLGQLAGGVGHELRNPLGVMTNSVYFLQAVLADAPPKVVEHLEGINAQIDLSQKIVGDLLDYARVKEPRRARVSPRALLERAAERAHPPEHADVHYDVADGVPDVWVDADQVGQVLLNLVMNAAQALPDEGGRIVLSAHPDGRGAVRLGVTDTGPGVPPELAAKIFQPLFTTKARGIGLGLAISRSLAEANDGTLELESPEEGGTRFVLTLPLGPPREAGGTP